MCALSGHAAALAKRPHRLLSANRADLLSQRHDMRHKFRHKARDPYLSRVPQVRDLPQHLMQKTNKKDVSIFIGH